MPLRIGTLAIAIVFGALTGLTTLLVSLVVFTLGATAYTRSDRNHDTSGARRPPPRTGHPAPDPARSHRRPAREADACLSVVQLRRLVG